jgi:endonuclease-3 related protein
MKNNIQLIYKELLKMYGPQGWWPMLDCKGVNPTKTGAIKGYHPGDYTYPKTEDQKFEICLGSILTQNTAWPNVEKALLNLKKLDAINPKRLLALKDETLKEAIRPAGYFNQKARKLKEFTQFYINLSKRVPTRDELLQIWGIGKETADSMLLFAYKVPIFKIDAYTKRIFLNLKLINPNDEYDEIKQLFESNLEKDFIIYQEYHALIVEHAKRYYMKKADRQLCPLYKKHVILH